MHGVQPKPNATQSTNAQPGFPLDAVRWKWAPAQFRGDLGRVPLRWADVPSDLAPARIDEQRRGKSHRAELERRLRRAVDVERERLDADPREELARDLGSLLIDRQRHDFEAR